jgi:hypothetical protein
VGGLHHLEHRLVQRLEDPDQLRRTLSPNCIGDPAFVMNARTRDDKGIVYLIDDRFARPAVQALLPSWWRITPAQPNSVTHSY